MNSAVLRIGLLSVFAAVGVAGIPNIGVQSPPPLHPAELDAKLAKVFEFYSRGLPAYTLEAEIARATKTNNGERPKEIVISNSRVQIWAQHLPSSQFPRGISPLLVGGIANADLVVMGVPTSARTLPIKDRTFLFTQYSIELRHIFSYNRRGYRAGDTIIVSAGGGSLMVDGVLVRATDPAFDEFRLNEPLILMVKLIRGTEAYQAVAPWTFIIRDELVSVASKIQPGRGIRDRKLPEFLADLDAALTYARK